ncbi:MAG: hypothetical protein ACTSYL_08735 [Candidatus Thorarchaeota archaeon]
MSAPLKFFKLSIERLHRRGVIEDIVALRSIAVFLNDPSDLILNTTLFEKKYCERSINHDSIRTEEIQRLLRVNEVSRRFRGIDQPLVVTGSNVRKKIESVLPPTMKQPIRDSLVVALGHIILNDVDQRIFHDIVPAGLDFLAAGILAISQSAKIAGQRIPWLEKIWQWHTELTKKKILQHLVAQSYREITAEEYKKDFERARDTLFSVSSQDPLLQERFPEWLASIAGQDTTQPVEQTILKPLRKSLRNELEKYNLVWGAHPIALRAESIIRKEHLPMVQSILSSVNILQCREIYDIFEYLSSKSKFNEPTIEKVMEITGLSTSVAAQFLSRGTSHLIIEHAFPSLSVLGLRYRYLINPQRREKLPSDGIAMSILVGPRRSQITAHIEPIDSQGPSSLSNEIDQLTVELETISLRIDLFDRETGEWTAPWIDRRPPRIRTRTIVTTPAGIRERITPRGVDLIGILWGIHTNRRIRQRVLKQMNLQRPMIDLSGALLQKRVLNLIYHPALEYIGLPETLSVIAKRIKASAIKKFTDWITKLFPVARVLYSDVKRGELGNVIAEIRLPPYSKAIVKGILSEYLADITEQHMVEPIIRKKTYYTSVLFNGYDFKKRKWIDPWSK